ncbi:MAG: sensor histidine kinase [Phycisphaerales bacterium]
MTRRPDGSPSTWAMALVVVALSCVMVLTQWLGLVDAFAGFEDLAPWWNVVAHAATGWVPWMVMAPLVAWLAIRFRFGTGHSVRSCVAHVFVGLILATGAAWAENEVHRVVDHLFGHLFTSIEPDTVMMVSESEDGRRVYVPDVRPDAGGQGTEPDGMQQDRVQPDGVQPDSVQQDGVRQDRVQPDSVQPDGVQPDGGANTVTEYIFVEEIPVAIMLPPGKRVEDIDWAAFDPEHPEASGLTVIDPAADVDETWIEDASAVDGMWTVTETDVAAGLTDAEYFATNGFPPPLTWVIPAGITYAVFIAIINGVLFAGDARTRQARADELQVELARSQLRVLRGQLQPHFLFNTLSSINVLMASDVPEARRMLNRLADLLRTSFREVRANETPLADEVRFIRSYLEIEQVRFGEQLRVTFDIDPATEPCLLPTMSLQPLVENSIKHGVGRRASLGEIRVSAVREGNDVVVTVADDGPGLDPAAGDPTLGVGIGNVRDRVERLHGPAGRVEIASAAASDTDDTDDTGATATRSAAKPHAGFAVTIRVPYRETSSASPIPDSPTPPERTP